jgi:glycosyltransferase involved in cell wall biosynthesis
MNGKDILILPDILFDMVKVLLSGMSSWHMPNTAASFNQLDGLSAIWTGASRPKNIDPAFYRRIWPYHLAQKPYYHLPFPQLEEWMRWVNLPFYDTWMRRQSLPADATVVQGPMGSCWSLFGMAERSGRKVLKVFDSTNSHPTTQFGYWQRECDLYSGNYRIPIPHWVRSRINREIEMADVVLCPSFFVRDTMIINGIPEEKCFVSHFGVDISIFKPRILPPAKPRFVCIGSLTVRKGHQYLLRAFAEVKKQMPDAELVCVGGIRPDFYKEFQRWQGTFTHHKFLSHPQIAELLTTSTAFVFPSLEEGFARVLSEAMACGIPIIASYESGATTIVNDGIEGIIVHPRNIPQIAHAMIAAAADKDANIRMGRQAFAVGGESNTWLDYAKRLHGEYRRRLAVTTSLS